MWLSPLPSLGFLIDDCFRSFYNWFKSSVIAHQFGKWILNEANGSSMPSLILIETFSMLTICPRPYNYCMEVKAFYYIDAQFQCIRTKHCFQYSLLLKCRMHCGARDKWKQFLFTFLLISVDDNRENSKNTRTYEYEWYFRITVRTRSLSRSDQSLPTFWMQTNAIVCIPFLFLSDQFRIMCVWKTKRSWESTMYF